jgi:acetamidase/formamidase
MNRPRTLIVLLGAGLLASGCNDSSGVNHTSEDAQRSVPVPEYSLSAEQTHNKFSAAIEPAIRVPDGAVVEVYTEEASDDQLTPASTIEDVRNLDFEPIHPLTGPVYVEGAEPGDVLAVTLHKIELGAYGWTAIVPGFGFLADEFPDPYLKTFTFVEGQTVAQFSDGITIPLKPFAGVMGVAPDTDEMLSTIPPRANGGNMDDPNLVEGTTVYFPVFVEGALFSIGDTHAAQGAGEVCGTAIEAPMRIVYEVNVIKGGPKLLEPQYETADTYAVTAFAETLDEAARKATRYMIDHLVQTYGMGRTDAYVLCSLAGDLRIAEVVDVPHVLVTMHMPKAIFGKE